MYKIAVTNRSLCPDIINKIKTLDLYDYIILREKDLPENEYYDLAKKAINVSDKIILHTFIDVAVKLNYRKIHLPYNIFIDNKNRLKNFDIVGVSTHSLEEALMCQRLKVDYITLSHIFATDCKKGIEPKGIEFLKYVCDRVDIPVFALGGINNNNINMCIEAGAKGVCLMSEAMK